MGWLCAVTRGGGKRALAGPRAEHAQDHGDLAGVVDSVLHDSFEQLFVGIVAAGNLFWQVFQGKLAKSLFKRVAALVPPGDEFVPGDGRLGPFLFGLPARERMVVGGVANAFVPEEQMLQQRGNGMRSWNGWRGGEFGRDLG